MLPKKMGLVICVLLLTITQGGLNAPLAWGKSQTTDASLSGIVEPNGPITSSQVTTLLLQNNQEIAALSWQMKSRKAAALQTVLLPNPELVVEVENFAGSSAADGFSNAETTISLSQLIELGGKRGIRRQVSGLDLDIAGLEHQARSIELVADARLAFLEVLAAQEKFQVATEQLKIAQEVIAVVQARVQAGKVSPIEASKAQISLSTSRINFNNAKRKLELKRKSLALFWGSTKPVFTEVVGNLLDCATEKPSIEHLSKQLENHLLIQKATLAVEQAKTTIRLARAGRIPDLTVSGGYRNFEESNDHAFVAGISLPLPTFDRNQGTIAEASHDLARAKSDLTALKTSMTTELNLAYQDLLAAELEAKILNDQVLPSAQSTFEAVREGYQQGKFSYLEVLDAQKTLCDLTLSRIEASSAYHASNIQLLRLTSLKLNFLPESSGHPPVTP